MNEAQIWDERYKNFTIENEKEKRNENSVFYKFPEKIKNALDIGCGTGEDLRNFAKRKIYVTGWDISEVAIGIAKKFTDEKTGKYIKYEIGDWKELAKKTPNESYDLVYSVMGPDMANIKSVREMSRMSKKYIRLLQFQDGKADIFEAVNEYLQKENIEEKEENEIIKLLKKLNYKYETEIVEIKDKVTQLVEVWLSYMKNGENTEEELDAAKRFFEEKSINGQLTANIKATYLQITWKKN